MKKLFPIFAVMAIVLSACGAGGGQPTAIPVATAFPTNTPPSINATAEVDNDGQAGQERVSPVSRGAV